MADARAPTARSSARRARSSTGPAPTLISTSRNAADAAASASITPVSASPRTAGDADSATSTPSSATSAAVSAICAGGSLAPSRASSRVGLGRRLQHRLVGGQLLLASRQRATRARRLDPPEVRRQSSDPIRAAISTSAAASAADRRGRPAHRAPACTRRPSRGTPPATACCRSVTRGYGSGVVTEEQVERFRRDGFLIIEEGLISMAAVEVLRERFAALFEGDYATGIAPDEVNWKRGPRPRRRDPPDLQRLARRRPDRRPGAERAHRSRRRPARRLPRHPHAPGQLPLEAARHEVARHAPGRLLRRLPDRRPR